MPAIQRVEGSAVVSKSEMVCETRHGDIYGDVEVWNNGMAYALQYSPQQQSLPYGRWYHYLRQLDPREINRCLEPTPENVLT